MSFYQEHLDGEKCGIEILKNCIHFYSYLTCLNIESTIEIVDHHKLHEVFSSFLIKTIEMQL